MKNINSIVESLITTYFYNRTNEEVLALIEEMLHRLNGYWKTTTIDVNQDADIAYGFLVLYYGDYGTSPRHGWIDDPFKEEIGKALNKQLESIKITIKISEK